MNSLLQSNCVNAAAAGNSQNSLTLRCDCVTAAAPSLGQYDCVLLPGLYGWATAWLLLLLHWGRITAICRLDYGRLRDCCCCFIGAVWLRCVVWTMGDCVTAAAASLGPYDCVLCSGLWATAWLLLLLHWGRMTALCCPDYGRLRDCCCCCFIGVVWLRYVARTMADCVTAAAASLGPFDCVLCSGLWATAWLLLLPHRGRMTAFSVRDYGRLRDCCCCFIGAVWLRCVVWTMADCVAAAAASLGPYDCVVLSGLWATAWLLLLLHWGRMTAFCVRDYARLRDCCCCFIGAVWLRYVVRTMADCVTAAAASLGPFDCVLCSGLWATAWLLLLPHRGRMTAFSVRDYGRLRDCCCCFIGDVWLRYVVWTMADCVTAAAASLGPYDCDMLFGLWATAWLLLLLLHWGRMTALFCLDYGRLRDCCCCFIGAVWLRYVGWTYVGCVTAAAAACDVSGMLAKTGHHCGADPGADAADIGTEAVWPHNWWLTAVRTAWLLLLSQWGQPDGRVLYGNRENIVRGAANCVSDAAACLAQPVCSLLSGLRDWCCCCTRGGSGRVSWWQLHRCKTAADALCLLKCSACCCSLVVADLVELSCTQIWCRFIMTDWPIPSEMWDEFHQPRLVIRTFHRQGRCSRGGHLCNEHRGCFGDILVAPIRQQVGSCKSSTNQGAS